MDIKTLRSKSRSALQKELGDAQIHLKELRFSLSSNQMSHVREVLQTRKHIARIQTLLNEQNASQT